MEVDLKSNELFEDFRRVGEMESQPDIQTYLMATQATLPEQAFEALCETLQQQERWKELLALYTQRAEYLTEPLEQSTQKVNAARVLHQQLHQPEQALALLEEALQEHAELPAAHRLLRQIRREQGESKAIYQELQESLHATEDPLAKSALLCELALLHLEQNNKTQAAISYHRAFLLDPKNNQAYNEAHRLYQNQNNWIRLLALLRAQIAQEPPRRRHAELLVELGQLLLRHRKGNPQEIAAYFREALDLDPKQQQAREGLQELAINKLSWRPPPRLSTDKPNDGTTPNATMETNEPAPQIPDAFFTVPSEEEWDALSRNPTAIVAISPPRKDESSQLVQEENQEKLSHQESNTPTPHHLRQAPHGQTHPPQAQTPREESAQSKPKKSEELQPPSQLEALWEEPTRSTKITNIGEDLTPPTEPSRRAFDASERIGNPASPSTTHPSQEATIQETTLQKLMQQTSSSPQPQPLPTSDKRETHQLTPPPTASHLQPPPPLLSGPTQAPSPKAPLPNKTRSFTIAQGSSPTTIHAEASKTPIPTQESQRKNTPPITQANPTSLADSFLYAPTQETTLSEIQQKQKAEETTAKESTQERTNLESLENRLSNGKAKQ